MKIAKYFARFGKVYGPFAPEEIEDLHATGRIRDYSWVWDEGARAWIPMDPAPPPLVLSSREAPREPAREIVREASKEGAASPVIAVVPPPMAMPTERLEVVCHNKHQFLVGHLDFLTQTGCELLTDGGGGTPVFADNAPVILNVRQGDSDRLLNVRARVCGISRSREGWAYRLRWDAPPDFTAREA